MKIIKILFVLMLVTQSAFAKPPKVSGNYEQGSRYAVPYDEIEYPTWWFEETEEIDQETWAYNYDKGYLQVSQILNKDFRYAVKYDYLEKNFFAATTNNKNRLNYYRAYSWIGLPYNMRLKTEYYIRHQNYGIRPWDNMTYVPHLLIQWKPNTKRSTDVSVRYKVQRYDEDTEVWKDKNQIDTYVGYREKVSEKLTLNTRYKYTFRTYTDNEDESNAVRKSMSVGFDYQF
ncbi:DUF5777 family beta-barrel protein [Elusimicrobiota bacterium]